MENTHLEKRTARDIDRYVERVLKDLGDPGPPLNLDDVRGLLKLDRDYYSANDDGILQQTVHQLKLAGKKTFKEPRRLLDLVRTLKLSALWLPDRRQILLDREMPSLKQRWGEAHEIGHALIEWHEPLMHGDERVTLSPACHEQLEAEANYLAGRLLFLRDRFVEEVRGERPTFDQVRSLSGAYKNTMESTLWRAVESLDIPAVGLIGSHPRYAADDEPARYFLRSPKFAAQFSNCDPLQLINLLKRFCFRRQGPLGTEEVTLTDSKGQRHIFVLDVFGTKYSVMTLGVWVRPHATVVAHS